MVEPEPKCDEASAPTATASILMFTMERFVEIDTKFTISTFLANTITESHAPNHTDKKHKRY
jgi:hypothetical protein